MPDGQNTPRGVGSEAEAVQSVAARIGLPSDQVRQLVRDGLQTGQIPASFVGLRGDRQRASPDELTNEKLDLAAAEEEPREQTLLADAAEPAAWSLGILRIISDTIEVDLLAAERYVRALLGKAPAIAAPVGAKDRGGRPVEHDWRHATRQVLRVRDYGWPATKAELIAELLDWFGRNYVEPPDESTVRRFISAIWPQGRCELSPRE